MLKTLIAEDEISELEWLSRYLLENHGDDVEIIATCTNGKDAVEIGLEKKPDLALLDIKMPAKTGLEVASILKEQDHHINIVFLTAYNDFEYARSALKIGASDYLLKPYDPSEIDAMIKGLLPKIKGDLNSELRKIVAHIDNTTTPASQKPVVRLALHYIETRYMEKISLELLSDDIGFSTSYVSKSLMKYLDKNFNTLLLETRCNAALKLMAEERLTVNEVAYKVGFSDPNYFGKCFKSYFGESPKAYSNRLMGKAHVTEV